MSRIFFSLFRSIGDLFHPRMLALLLIPPVGALILWGGLAYLFWAQLFSLSMMLGEKFLYTREVPVWMVEWFSITPEGVATALAALMAVLLILPLTVLTSILLTSVIAMPVITRYMKKFFPNLEKKGSGLFIASTTNMIRSSAIYLSLWVVTLPLWMIPGMGVALSLLLNGYLNYRLLVFDSLGDWASPEEVKALLKRRRVDFLLLGVLTSTLVLIPPLFLILPIYSGLCFARYALIELERFRKYNLENVMKPETL